MKQHIVIRIFLLLVLSSGASYGQSCVDCNLPVDISTSQDFFVSEGTQLCIAPGVECSGNIFLSGGTICNQGKVDKLVIEGQGGTIYNYSEMSCNQLNILADMDVLIENYPGGSLTFGEILTLNINPTANFLINNYRTSTVTAINSIQVNGGAFTFNNGRIWEPNADLEGQGVVNLTTFQVSDCNFTLDNAANGTIHLSDDFIIQNTLSKTITNAGVFTIEGNLQIEGTGDTESLVSVTNSSLLTVSGNLSIDIETSAVNVTNVDDASAGIEMSIGASLIVSAENCTITNGAQLTIGDDVSAQAGRLLNNKNIQVEDQMTIGSAGIFENGSIAEIKSLVVNSGGAVNNISVIRIVTSMSNSGLISLGKDAAILTNQYTNNSSGTITGPTLDAVEVEAKKHGKIWIDGSSSHAGTINGNTFVQDNSLSCPNDYGFDVVVSGANIDDAVQFGTSCSGGVVVYNCNWQFASTCSLVATGPTGTICPYGPAAIPAPLQGQLYRTNGVPGVYPTPIAGMSYTWLPGGFVGQNFQPTVTGVYTVTTLFNGCLFTATVQVNVMNVQTPVITYTTAPYMPSPPVVFTPTLVGQTGGVWTIGPNNAPYVTINPSTGQITASGPESYGIYDVCYQAPGFSADGGTCAPYLTCTQVTLTSAACPFSVAVPFYTLCPEDKIVLNVSGGFGTYYWSPPPASPTVGLSCTACATPTFVYDGTTSQVTVQSLRDGVTCGTGTIRFTLKENCQKDEIIGCCFSNYGASIWVNDDNTHINIHCNLVNELGITSSVIQKGEFENIDGFVRVSLDWIHNAKNNLYIDWQLPASSPPVETGTTVLFGFDQKVKGNSNTHFYELRLENSSNKSLWIDEYAHSDLYLNDAAMEIQNNMFLMKNDASNIQRTSGFATTGVYGYFTRAMKNGTIVKHYLYPLGGKGSSTTQLRYRPVMIDNKATTQTDEIAVNFMNIPPALNTDPVYTHTNTNLTNVITALAPNVQIRFNNFYHKIKNLVTPVPQSTVNIKVYYAPGDGNFQSLSEWELGAGQTLDWWGATPGSAASTQTSSAPETPGLLYAQSEGGQSFEHTPFALARGGFYVNTSNFGNNGGGSGGAVITVTPTGSGPGTPTGGGLGSSFGTGANSGNSGTGGNTMYTPNPVAGEYVMTITPPNDCGIEGKVKFYVDQNGYINPDLVEYRNSNNVPLGPLSSEIFSVDVQNSGISFNSSPSELLRACVNSITITTSTNADFIVSGSTDNLVLNLPAATSGNTITYGQIKFYDKNGTLVYTANPSPSLSIYSFLPSNGPYKFEMLVTATGLPPVSEVITGHIIRQ